MVCSARATSTAASNWSRPTILRVSLQTQVRMSCSTHRKNRHLGTAARCRVWRKPPLTRSRAETGGTMQNTKRSIRRATLAAAPLLSTALCGTAIAQPRAGFDIPAQPLSRALAQFGLQSGFQVIADSALTASKNSHGVNGALDADKALDEMLEGTGLTYRRTDGSFMIFPATQRSADIAP